MVWKALALFGGFLIFIEGLAILGLLSYTYLELKQDCTRTDPVSTTNAPISSTESPYEPIDYSKGAYKASAQLLYALNLDADPCEDFVEFACGNWIRKNPITPSIPVRRAMDDMQDNIAAAVGEAMVANVSGKMDFGKKDWLKKGKAFFDACQIAHDNVTEPVGVSDMLKLIEHFGGWEVINYTVNNDAAKMDFSGLMGKLYHDVNELTLLADPNFFIKNIISFDRNMFEISNWSPEQIENYKAVMIKISKKLAKALVKPISSQVLQQHAEAMIAFEKKLAGVPFGGGSPTVTIKELEASQPVLWNKFFYHLFGQEVYDGLPEKYVVILQDMDAKSQTNFSKIISTSGSTAKNWLIWRMIFTNMRHNQPLRSLLQTAQPEISAKSTVTSCGQLFLDVMSLASGRIIVDYIADDTTKLVAKTMGNYIVDSYKDEMSQISWLDSKSKKAVFDKINNFKVDYAWPDWITSDLALNDWYKGIEIWDNVTFATMLLQAYSQIFDRAFQYQIHPETSQLQMFPTSLGEVNALYDDTSNHLWILAGIMQPPFFNPEFPPVLNYGGVGVVIGHEMGHGYDRNGVKYNYKGDWDAILEQTALDTFLNRTECLVDQYNQYCFPGTEICEQGQTSLTENEADVIGVRMSYRAYQKWARTQGQKVRLPNMEQFSSDQLFFMNFARGMCANFSMEAEKQASRAVHSADTFRILGGIRNVPEFADAFNCPPNSYMNLEKKCLIWNSCTI